MMFNGAHGCDSYLQHLGEYLDGELTDAECAALKEHLADCPPCLDEYQRDAIMKALVRRSCQCESAPVALRTQIMQRISTQVTTVEIHRID
ncbi:MULTISPECIES: mycothiol system anti-sigma-R factor [unclassified Yimella]|uniref:mycothiol system anti-sigma-R factor n=1 Tax=unclassified Yimella TaxID=2649892 RepID=UPI00101C69CC|nr:MULTISPECIES: mycothiol system anti-sigma-R factor [unclassified Yimella]MCG8655930.1 mycothiol system anti-sigma-R factor [Yimella sp. NH-Cas1]RYG75962.1 mycothiol system anti-sigma-R factor [Yimella sp. RIT 621]